jgi:hypothetical protein
VAKRPGNEDLVKSHDAYWGTEAAMSEGSPPLILERGESVEVPPALVIQRSVDPVHPLEMQQHLVEWYRKRGGQIDMPLFDNLPRRFLLTGEYPDANRALETIADFVKQHS